MAWASGSRSREPQALPNSLWSAVAALLLALLWLLLLLSAPQVLIACAAVPRALSCAAWRRAVFAPHWPGDALPGVRQQSALPGTLPYWLRAHAAAPRPLQLAGAVVLAQLLLPPLAATPVAEHVSAPPVLAQPLAW